MNRAYHLRTFLFAILIIVTSILSDQLTKLWVIEWMLNQRAFQVPITPFFSIVLVKNTGVSFGMGQGLGLGPWFFISLASMIVLWLVIWAIKSKERWLRLSLALVIGGAIGNIIDRIRYGGVIDFLDLHLYGYHWPAFNLADSYVVLGIVFLLIDSFVSRGHRE